MTKRELEDMVSGVKSPPLDRKQTRKLFEESSHIELQRDNKNEVVQHYSQPVPPRVAQPVPPRVAQPVPQRVAQPVPQRVAQPVPQRVAQPVPQRVAQPVPQKVAQSLWVAQNDTLLDMVNIAQSIGQKVVKPFKPKSTNKRLEKSSYDQSVWEGVEKLKEYIYNLPTIEDRKKFVLNIGWGIGEESRGKKNYLYGAKKINSIKYKLYIGNSTHL